MSDSARALIVSLLVTNPDKITGISSYTFSLLRALEEVHDGSLRLLTSWTPVAMAEMGLSRTEITHLPRSRAGMLAPISFTLAANRHLQKSSDAVLLSTNPMASFRCPIPQITVFHDMYRLHPGHYRTHQRLFFQTYVPAVVRASQAIVAVSHTTAEEVIAWTPTIESKLHVIGEGSQFAPERAHDPDRLSLLFVANIEANKNVGCLLEALRLLEAEGAPVELRWIGRDRSGELDRWLAANGPLKALIPLGVLDQAGLAAEYRRAGALVVPSTAEGFCLPVIEAQGFGLPTILADIPVLREVGGGAGLYFDPRDPRSLATAILEFRADRTLRQTLGERSQANASRYSWRDAALAVTRLAETLRR